ncbi:MAG: hypothetical protein GX079_00105 [Tissierellia bacterium]|nr:hypothetical protein [Tissierellia bacterium]
MDRPSYDEFYNEVKRYFWLMWPRLPEEEVDRYLKEEEKYVKTAYFDNLEEFDSGEINRRTFLIGGASSIANCLQLMY